ncbi:MAG: amidohydrolase family protein [bacterium]
MSTVYKILLCDVLNPITDKKAKLTRQAAIVLKSTKAGFKIHKVGPSNKIVPIFPGATIIDRSGQLALPGFFDMHFHWVQDDVRLMPKDSLLEWLSKYTWPYEMKFKSKKYSKEKAKKFSKELLSVGTLGGAVYASIHGHTVDDALENFTGNYIAGNVLMTMNSPKGLSQTREQALKLIESLSAKWGKAYAMTPRFAPTTHPDVMKAGAWLAKKRGSFIQTHLSESKDEINYVLGLYKDHQGFENIPTYTDIYKKCGMLGKKTIMGHGIHLSPDELITLSKTGTVIAHCPTSNAPVKDKGLGSGLFNFKKIEKAGVRWPLAAILVGVHSYRCLMSCNLL